MESIGFFFERFVSGFVGSLDGVDMGSQVRNLWYGGAR